MKKKKTELKPKAKGGLPKSSTASHKDKDWSGYGFPHHAQMKTREIGFCNKRLQVNSEYIFNQPNFKKNTKGYDKLTGEIEKRGRPADNQDKIFLKKPEPEKTFQQIKKEKEKNDAKKREAYNKKLYKDRLKTKWDRGW